MGKFYDEIPTGLLEWIRKQQMFWIATAPLNPQGHINLSPKGIADCFHVVNSKQVWYEDLTGSGGEILFYATSIETISHLRENGRITVMFCSFEGPPRVMRLFGVGTVHEYGSPEYNRLVTSRKPGSRAVVFIDVYQVGTSCGYAVPLYDFVMHRTQLHRLINRHEDGDRVLAAAREEQRQDHFDPEMIQGDDKILKPSFSLRAYWLKKNMKSLDGLPGLVKAPDAILNTTPQNQFDKESPRPRLRRDTQTSERTRDLKWFASGVVLGAVTVFAVSSLAGCFRE